MRSTFSAAAGIGAIAAVCSLSAGGVAVATAGPAPPAEWERLIAADAPIDLAGPRADGTFVQAAAGRLFTLSADLGGREPFAQGPRGYRTSAGEPYIALGDASGPADGGCAFRPDDLFALEPRRDPAVIRISRSGRSSRFASLSDRFRLDGIAFDRVGSFGHRLLVIAVDGKRTSVIAIDCAGRKATISANGPRVEGGIEVAPQTFGAFAGQLIAADEYSGRIFAFAPTGEVAKLVDSGLPAGRDRGVESVGFVPPGFGAPGRALVSDRGREEERAKGAGSLLSIGAPELAAAGVGAGDLLVATERGAETIRVRCDTGCTAEPIASGPAGAHVEGHLIFAESGIP